METRVALNEAPAILRRSPWGQTDQVWKLGEGAWLVNTPGHGGIYLSPDRVKELPEVVRGLNTYGGPAPGGGAWFEEDCEWALVWFAFPDLFEEKDAEGARKTLARCYPKVLGIRCVTCGGELIERPRFGGWFCPVCAVEDEQG